MRIRSVGTAVLVVLSVASVMSAGSSAGAAESTADARTATVTAPVAAGKGISEIGTGIYDTPIGAGYDTVGYVREEYFFEGEAVGYEPVGTFSVDGKWKVDEGETAAYKTRMLVVRPEDPADFNGTVYVEWLNVSAGFDASRSWIFGHNQMLREGAIWVGISAQAAGISGTTTIAAAANNTVIAVPTGGLKTSDPERYGTLNHPGDAFSYDMFTQAGAVVNGDGEGIDPLDGYDVKRVIATGESQSAARLTTYANVVEPIEGGVFDAFFILHRSGTPSPLGTQVQGTPDPTIPVGAQTRKDLEVPVFVFETETDIQGGKYADARQPDSKNFRLWEVAGTSHVDAYSGIPAIGDFTGDGKAEAILMDPVNPSRGSTRCDQPVNAGGQHAVVRAALVQLERWVKNGTPPTKYPRVKTTGTADTIDITRDENGIALGGVRTPIVDVPIGANNGDANTPAATCTQNGTNTPFDAAKLATLYPNGNTEWVKAFNAAADKAVKDGIWLKPEAKNFKAAASQITFG